MFQSIRHSSFFYWKRLQNNRFAACCAKNCIFSFSSNGDRIHSFQAIFGMHKSELVPIHFTFTWKLTRPVCYVEKGGKNCKCTPKIIGAIIKVGRIELSLICKSFANANADIWINVPGCSKTVAACTMCVNQSWVPHNNKAKAKAQKNQNQIR